MKANRPQAERALKAPAETRFFLLHGPDEAGSRALLKLLAGAMGPEAERIDLSGAMLKSDPARLADEAAAFSMFGGARYVVVDQAGDESLSAVEALLAAPPGSAPVVLLAGALKPSSKLLKLALAERGAVAFASYLPDMKDAERVVTELARAEGLDMRGDVARRLAEACGGNRSIIAQEVAKLALYLDASPQSPKPADHDALDAVGAESDEGDLGRLVDSALLGDAGALHAELTRLEGAGADAIPILRAMARRIALLARLRADVEAGSNVAAVMASKGKSLFWKDEKPVTLMISRWRADLLARAMSRLMEAQRQTLTPGGPGPVAVEEALFATCRQAARLR